MDAIWIRLLYTLLRSAAHALCRFLDQLDPPPPPGGGTDPLSRNYGKDDPSS